MLYTVLTSLALVGFSVSIYAAVQFQSYSELERDLMKRSSHIIEQVEVSGDKLMLPPSLTRSSILEIRYEVLIDSKGKAFFKNPLIGDRSIVVEGINLSQINNSPEVFNATLNDNTPVKVAIIRLKKSGEKAYFATARPIAEVKQRLKDLALIMVAANVLFVLLVIGIGNYFVLRALKPVQDITEMAKEISRGDLSKRVNLVGSHDELKELADTFDEMISRLERLLDGQKRFFQDVSHELRTPLTIIRGKVDVALRAKELSKDDQIKVLEDIKDETELAADLVNDLLTVARGEKIADDLKIAEFPVDRTLIEIGARLYSLGKQKDIRVDVKVPEQPVLIMGDETRFGEAILAVGDNAIKYCGPGDSVQLSLVSEGEFAIITIVDNGPGIRAEDQPFIFERFYRSKIADKLPRGTGLGLAIAKNIAESHKGELYLKSCDSSGTVFEFKLPLAHQSTRA
jgi:signal transduction histidine kinase